LNDHGLLIIDNFVSLIEKDVNQMCSNIRKPGGTINNPSFNMNAPVAGVPAMIPNPGLPVGHI
jgi:hypothetical protein